MAFESPGNDLPPRAGEAGARGTLRRRIQWVFFGPQGEIRVGWRLLMATSLFFAIATVFGAGLTRIPAVHSRLASLRARGVITPMALLFGEGLSVCAVFLSALIMARIENRSFTQYGLPSRGAFGKRFWQGAILGFSTLSLLMGGIGALHGFELGGWAASSGEALRNGLLYLAAFLLVGVFEEFSFRGYLQATLSQAIGFWPAATVLSIVFGASHAQNLGESKLGALMAVGYGLFGAFCLQRTGNLWFIIGEHATWDWGETYFYSVPNSGVTAAGHLLNSSFHGPVWLTGGAAGPEGSVLVFAILALETGIVHYMFPAKRTAP